LTYTDADRVVLIDPTTGQPYSATGGGGGGSSNPNGQATMAASAPVVIASNQSAVPVSAASLPLPAGAATDATVAAMSAKLPAQGQAVMAASQPVVIASNQSNLPVNNAQLNGTTVSVNAGNVDAGTQRVVLATNQASVATVASPPTTVSTLNVVTAATTNATSVKTSAGSLFEVTISNVTAATIYVKLFNKASAPTVGTDVPVVTIPVAAGATANLGFGQVGKRFATGIALAVTAASAATDTTVVTAGAQIHGSYI